MSTLCSHLPPPFPPPRGTVWPPQPLAPAPAETYPTTISNNYSTTNLLLPSSLQGRPARRAPSSLGVGGLSWPAATCADPDGGSLQNGVRASRFCAALLLTF